VRLSLPRTFVGDLSKETAQVNNSEVAELMVGEGGVVAEQLVLVALKRISVGSWAPCIRLINDQE
jgi:hypothetical protein